MAISLGPAVIEALDGDGPKPSLTVLVYDRLKEEILQVRRRPGDLLLEGDLAKLYQVSKTPVREALRLLARDGWIVVLPRKGYLIRPLRLDDVREVFAIRSILEPAVAAQAALSITPAEIARLRTIVAEQASSVGETRVALGAARRFHDAVCATANNGRLSRVLGELLDEVSRLHFLLPNVESHVTSQEELRAHRRLVVALAAHDSDKASAIMQKHVSEVARALVTGFGGL